MISRQIQQSIKPIQLDDEDKFEVMAREVEDYELRKLIGLEFYEDLKNNQTNEKYTKLLEGDSFTIDGKTYNHKGLYFVLAYFIYAKYIGQAGVTDTYSGVVVHNHEFSNRVSDGTVKRLQQDALQIALFEFELIKKYIYVKKDDYPLFFYGRKSDYNEVFKPKFYGVRKYGKL